MGYSVPNAISATYKVAYGYALELVEEYKAVFLGYCKNIAIYSLMKVDTGLTKKDLELIINIAKKMERY